MSTKIIADACANHQGKPELIEKMIKQAAAIDVDYIKFQVFKSDWLTPKWPDYEKLKEYYESVEIKDYAFILQKCWQYGIKPLFTIFREIPYGLNKDVSIAKIASPDCNNWDLIDKCYSAFGSLIISTGMHHGFEIKKLLKRYSNPIENGKITILFCRSIYPIEHYNEDDFVAMKFLQDNCKSWGISDHSKNIGNMLYILKYTDLKPNYIERHFIFDKNMDTKDSAVSSDIQEFMQLTSYPLPVLTEGEENKRIYKERWNG